MIASQFGMMDLRFPPVQPNLLHDAKFRGSLLGLVFAVVRERRLRRRVGDGGFRRTFTRIVEFLRSLFCCRYDREPAHDLNLPVRLDGMSGQERKNETGDFIVLFVQGEMAGVE